MREAVKRDLESKVTCIKCNIEKDISNFVKDKYRKSGHHPYCKDCQRPFKEKNAIKNRSINIKRATDWNRNNPERRSEINKSWNTRNKEKCRIYKANRRALEKKLSDGTLTSEALKSIPDRDCGICNKKLDWSNPAKIHLDHIVPLSKGGLNSITNVQWSHAKCNLSKGSK